MIKNLSKDQLLASVAWPEWDKIKWEMIRGISKKCEQKWHAQMWWHLEWTDPYHGFIIIYCQLQAVVLKKNL